MEIVLKVRDCLEKNAQRFFDSAKQAKKKGVGARRAYEISLAKKARETPVVRNQAPCSRKRKWFEKFRWFITSDGMLVIGGRDATTNEIIIKKHTDQQDIVLHTEMAGSPFVVIKAEGQSVSRTAIEEAAAFTAAISRAWKLKLGTAEVFYVKPGQVSKAAGHGEYVAKGAFVITGATTHVRPPLAFAIGAYDGTAMGGPRQALIKHCPSIIDIEQGDEKPSDIAKIIKKSINVSLDEIIASLPSGGMRIKKHR